MPKIRVNNIYLAYIQNCLNFATFSNNNKIYSPKPYNLLFSTLKSEYN